MKDPLLSRALEITDPRAAAAFVDPVRRELILRLAAKECTLTQLAAVTGIELKRAHYHVTALCALRLVVVRRRVARAGRPIKLYGAVA